MANKVKMKAEGLRTGYKSHRREITVTECIDAELKSGELTCMLGPNGSGKSTLMRTMAGFLKPLGGRVMIEGESVEGISRSEMAQKVSVVLTSRIDAQNITVRELVELGRSPYTGFFGKTNREDREAADKALEMTGITELADRRVTTLSDGERQKAMIAKALAQDTPIILLDEPTAYLDYPSKVGMMALLKRLAKERDLAVLISTHDMEIALQLADSLWLIDKTKGVKTGSCAELSGNGSVAEYFDNNELSYDSENRMFRIAKGI